MAYKQLRNTNILTTLLESCAQRRVDNQARDIADSDRTSKVPHSRTQIVLDVIPYLIDVICPRVRPLMMITMSPVEQSLLMGKYKRMYKYSKVVLLCNYEEPTTMCNIRVPLNILCII